MPNHILALLLSVISYACFQRKTMLYKNYLGDEKWKYEVAIDEAWIYLLKKRFKKKITKLFG